jgi:membrane protease subunit (stomatin/prohibitin family)
MGHHGRRNKSTSSWLGAISGSHHSDGGHHGTQRDPATPAAPVSRDANAVQCPSCRAINPITAKFCVDCGNGLQRTATICAACRATVPQDAKFCPDCGQVA